MQRGKSDRRIEFKPTGKPAGKPATRPAARPSGKPTPAARPGAKATGRPAGPTSRPGGRPEARPAGRRDERPARRDGSARPADRGFDRGAERGFDRGNDRGNDRGSDRGFDRAVRPSFGASSRPAPRTREQFSEGGEDAEHYIVGRRAVLELLKSDDAREKIEKLYVAHGSQGPQMGDVMSLARKLKIAVGEIDRGKFRDLERRATSGADRMTDAQGVIALRAPRAYQELEDVVNADGTSRKDGSPVFLIALDGIEDPHNIGAIIRSAEAAGVHAVLMPRRGAVLTPAALKTSAGAAEHIDIVKVQNLAESIRKLREEFGVLVLGLAGEGERTLHEVDLNRPLCFVTGSEEKGLNRLTRDRCDELVKIPLFGKTASLNASVASAVAIFEALRQRTVTA